MDIWLLNVGLYSYDGVPFLMRDSTLKRTTNVAEVFPNRTHLHASTFSWAELQQLNAGDWFLVVRPSTHACWHLKQTHTHHKTSHGVWSFLHRSLFKYPDVSCGTRWLKGLPCAAEGSLWHRVLTVGAGLLTSSQPVRPIVGSAPGDSVS